MTTLPEKLYTKLEQYQPARELVEAAKVLLDRAEKYQAIPTDADAEVFSEFRARLNHTITKLDEERLAATEPLRTVVASMNAEAALTLDPMRVVLKRVDKVFKDYCAERDRRAAAEKAALEAEQRRLEAERVAAERKAEEARRAAAEEADATKRLELVAQANEAQRVAEAVVERQEVVTQAVVSAPTETGKSILGSHGSRTGLRENWVWDLTDISQVPDMWLLPPEERLDKRAITSFVKAKKDKSNIPGITPRNDPITNSRVSR